MEYLYRFINIRPNNICGFFFNNLCIGRGGSTNQDNDKKNSFTKYIILRDLNGLKNIFCLCMNDEITIRNFKEKIRSFLHLDKNKFEILIYGNNKENIDNYNSMHEIINKIKSSKEYAKKSKVFPKYINYVLDLTYEIKEKHDYLFNLYNESIEKKYRNEKKEIINIHFFGKEPIVLDVTKNFTINEIKFLIYKKENIPINKQLIVPFEEKKLTKDFLDLDKINNYFLYSKQNFCKDFFSPKICNNIDYNNIDKYRIDIYFDEDEDYDHSYMYNFFNL